MGSRTLGAALVVACVVLVLGVSTLTVQNSPFEGDANPESTPWAPPRPATLNASTAGDYAVWYEERTLYHHLLDSRGHNLDENDEVHADCRDVSVSEMDRGAFRVALRCQGDIDDSLRLFEPGPFTYSITYRVTGNATEVLEIEDYPFDQERGLYVRQDRESTTTASSTTPSTNTSSPPPNTTTPGSPPNATTRVATPNGSPSQSCAPGSVCRQLPASGR